MNRAELIATLRLSAEDVNAVLAESGEVGTADQIEAALLESADLLEADGTLLTAYREALTTPGDEWMGTWEEWEPIYNRLPVYTRSLVSHMHGHHQGPMLFGYCTLCERIAKLDRLASGDSL